MLFLHGAGGFDDDRLIADDLARSLGVDLEYPRLPDEDMSYDAWAGLIGSHLGRADGDIVVGHSFGASILLRVLAENPNLNPAQAILLAAPDWSPDGWDVEEYAFAGPEPRVPITLHHCRDDEDVPFEHLALLTGHLPSARVVEHHTGGHQFIGVTDAVAAECRPSRSST